MHKRQFAIRLVLTAVIVLVAARSGLGKTTEEHHYLSSLPLLLRGYSEENIPPDWQEGLAPGKNWGLAAAYPNDVGISANPYVLGAEDFESGTVRITTEQDRYVLKTIVVDTDTYTGAYAGEHRWPHHYNGPTTRFQIPATAHQGLRPSYFIRMCMNFDNSFHPGLDNLAAPVGIKGFGIFSEPDGNDLNSPCNGTNWYNAQIQFVGWGPSIKPQANNGFLWVGHLYSYNPYPGNAVAEVGTVHVSEPSQGGKPYRFSAYAAPFDYLRFNSWRCYEVGLYLNTPGKYNGEARFWIDGVLQSRVTHMRYRDVEELLPTDMHLNVYRVTTNFPQTMIRRTDNIVLATRYIGPVKKD